MVPRYAPYEGVEPAGISVPLDLPQPSSGLLAADLQQPACMSDEAGAAGTVVAFTADTAAAAEPSQAAGSGQPAAESGSQEAVEQGAQREDSADKEEPAAVPLEQQGLAQHAELYQCWQGGVHRVFVDHPLFHSSGGLPWSGVGFSPHSLEPQVCRSV